jgi:membrane fusion protein, multidrug efflux system
MGHFKSMDLPDPGAAEAATSTRPVRERGKSRWWIWLLVIAVAAGGYWYFRSRNASQAADPPAAGAQGKGRGGAAGNFAVPVVVASSVRGDLPVYFNGLGTVTAFNTVTVHSRVDGQIDKVAFTEGQFVHQGELLVEIDPRPFQVQLEQAQGQLAKDEAQRKDAEVNLERFKLLFNEGVIPKQQLDTQAAQVGQFDGAIKTDQGQIDNAKLQLTYSRVTAPISGRVGLRLVDVGNIVHATDAQGVVVITQLQPISVIFALPQDQLPAVNAKLNSRVPLTVDAFDRDDTAKIASGKLLTIDNQIDTTTGTYKLKSTFNNENNVLFPNQFVNVHLLVDVKKDLVIVPAPAIQRGPQGTYVYAVGEGNTAKIKPVTIALTSGSSIGLSNGLNPGEVVVVDGADKLQEGSKVTPSTNSNGGRNANAAADQPAQTPTPTQTQTGAQPNPQRGGRKGQQGAGKQ